jgi:predicted ATP-grasp superfamily ATP-dependent carboligase
MNQPKKILVTSGAWQASLACIQSLGRKGHEVFLVDNDPRYLAVVHSKYCRGHIDSPPELEEERYIKFLLKLVKANKYDLLIPISDRCVRYCAKYQEELRKFINFTVPRYDTLMVAVNKTRTYEFAKANNISIPNTYFPVDRPEVFLLAEKELYPCVVKMPMSSASKGVFFVRTKSELMGLYQNNNFDGQWPVIQELVEGDYYSFNAVAYKGKILSYFVHTAPRAYSVGGTLPFSFSVNDPVLWTQANALIAALNWSGAININYLKEKKRGYLLIEINPRFPGGLNFAYRMGVDLPWDYYQLALGGNPSEIEQPAYRTGVLFRTILPTEILWLYKRKGYGPMFLRNFLRFGSKTNIYWDDLKLLWWQIKETRWYCHDIKREMSGKGNSS